MKKTLSTLLPIIIIGAITTSCEGYSTAGQGFITLCGIIAGIFVAKGIGDDFWGAIAGLIVAGVFILLGFLLPEEATRVIGTIACVVCAILLIVFLANR